MDRITDTLYLGAYDDAIYAPVGGEGIRGTFNLAERPYEAVLPMRHYPIPDALCLQPQVWQCLVDLLHSFIHEGHAPVLVHCRLGVSRSPALVAAYLAWTGAYSDPAAALGHVQRARAVVTIHEATWRGVLQWWTHRKGTSDVFSSQSE